MRGKLTLAAAATLLTLVGPATANAVARTDFTVGACAGQLTQDGIVQAAAPGPVVRAMDAPNVPLDSSVKVSPPLIELLEVGPEGDARPLAAGDTLTCFITVRNRRAVTTTFRIEPSGVLGTKGATGIRFVSVDTQDAASTAGPWITPAVGAVTLRPREYARVPVTIAVPPDPPVGSAYGSVDVIAPIARGAGAAGSAVGFEPRIAVQMLLRVGGTGRAKLQLEDVQAARLRWNRDPWTLRADLANDGTLHATPTGRVRVRSLFGNTVAELPIRQRPLLPGGEARLERSWRGVPWLGLYRYDVRVAPGASDAGDPARATGWFVALPPLWILVALSLLAAALAVGGVRRRNRAHSWNEPDEHLDD